MELKDSKTALNLMRAFAGEGQARNRYEIAAETAGKQQLYCVEALFKFTAKQELAHAKIFFDRLKSLTGENLTVDGDYPVCVEDDPVKLLRCAADSEAHEGTVVYPDFAAVAKNEGFDEIAGKFDSIAAIENSHSQRLRTFADMLEQNKLFLSDVEEEWVCLNCGHRFRGKEVPPQCPVCSHPKGYIVRAVFEPYTA